jgi:diadenosine tetraphosphate (Ap4A) HIT family hydrolase
MGAFSVHPAIIGDNLVIGDLPLCRVILTNDSRYHWLMLLPRRQEDEIVDLAEADQIQLIREVAAASAAVRAISKPHKLNCAALGNKVRQMHFHVIGRQTNDPAWPEPVWGHSPAVPFKPADLKALGDTYRTALAGAGLKEIKA